MACCRKNQKPAVKADANDKYRGVNVDRADGGRVNCKLEKEDVKILNNNPRNDDM